MPPWSNKSSKRNAENAKLKINAKNKILTSITDSVSEVQYQYRPGAVSSIPSNEITARLCTSLEEIASACGFPRSGPSCLAPPSRLRDGRGRGRECGAFQKRHCYLGRSSFFHSNCEWCSWKRRQTCQRHFESF